MMARAIARALAAMLLLLCGASGHMIMNTPTPYNLNTHPLLQVDPLSGGQFPFPCHNHYSFTSRTLVEVGSATLVNFTGGAQHGGGSCQFSISYDEPTDGGNWSKSAKFKTIYTIIGGCPAVFTNEQDNLPPAGTDANRRQDGNHCDDDQGVDCIRQFMIPIPGFLKNGPATFAWTWFNKLGKKDMYMNCAPVNITGGTGDQKQIDELPDIFIANYPGDSDIPNCVTGTNADKVVLNIPNPGKYGRILAPPLEPVVKPPNYCSQIPPASAVPTFLSDPGSVPGGERPSSSTPSAISVSTLSPALSSTRSTSVTSASLVCNQGDKSTTVIQTTSARSTSSRRSYSSTTTVTVTAYLSSGQRASNITVGTTTITTRATSGLNTASHSRTALPKPSSSTSETLVVIPITGPPRAKTTTTTTTATESTARACVPSSASKPATPTSGSTAAPTSQSQSHSQAKPSQSSPTSSLSTSTPPPPSTLPAPAGPGPVGGVACATHGELVCLEGGAAFGLCDWGWAVPRPLAAGTRCMGGKIVKRRDASREGWRAR